jgi:hypothetical protein
MAETADSLYRRGAISAKQGAKLGILKKTKVERDKEESFDGKQGLKDQGAGREKGHKEASVRHIDVKKDIGSPERASGAPSKGGRVNSYGQPGTDEIDRGSSGKGGKNTKKWPSEGDETSAKQPMNKRSKGKIAKQGGQYGGGGRDTQ